MTLLLIAKRFLWCSWRHHVIWRRSWKMCLECLAAHVRKHTKTKGELEADILPLFICGGEEKDD